MSETQQLKTGQLSDAALLEFHFFMRLSREWELRFEKLFRTGAVAKWYSAVGNEAITVPAATCIEAGDALFTLHRDSGAILRYYLDVEELLPGRVPVSQPRRKPGVASGELFYRLACQVLGAAAGFSEGYERSYHYNVIDADAELIHVGMISHLGAMIPVAAGAAFALKRRGSDRVALNFIGDGGTSTGDFHEGLNMAAVLRAPLILVIENNQYALSTPVRQQYAAESLAARAAGYGIPGARVDGHDAEAVWAEVGRAVDRARNGEGPTVIEAVVQRLRGHSEGDDSHLLFSEEDRKAALELDCLRTFEGKLVERDLVSRDYLDDIRETCARLVLEVADRALASRESEPEAGERPIYAD